MKRILILLLGITVIQTLAASYTIQSTPNPKTADRRTYVSNPDGIITSNTVSEINILLDSLEKNTGTEVAVVLLNSIGLEDINIFATELFKHWGIGKAQQNNGVLILFVLDQKKIRFETGYGIEGVLPDAISKRIQMQNMIPYFRNGDYDLGILEGTKKVVSVIRNEPFDTQTQPAVNWREVIPYALAAYLLLGLLAILWIQNRIQKIRTNQLFRDNLARYKAIKAEKNGINALISILVPVGGFLVIMLLNFSPLLLLLLFPVPLTTLPASAYAKRLMNKIRREPIKCAECGEMMHFLPENREDEHLKLSQQFEEQLHAIDYDVFVCDSCSNEAIFTLDKPSAYSPCPRCGTKAFIQHSKRIVVAPTYISAGTERTTFRCSFCGFEENHNRNIPRLQRTGAFIGGAAGGTIFSGRGGFGRGGFGGGSFGGGLSGGGGATSGW